MKKSFLLLFVYLLSITPCFSAGNIAAGKEKATVCAACHAIDGNSSNPIWPKIAGQYADYLSKEVHDILKGDNGPRPNAVMYPMVTNLSDQDIADLSAYFASQQATPGNTTADQKVLAAGNVIFETGIAEKQIPACKSCHGPDGFGVESAGYPNLAAQHAEYLAIQLKAFRDGTRKNDLNEMMRNITKNMTDDEITAIANYLESLPPSKNSPAK